MNTFTRVDDRVLQEVIAGARQRLVFIAPGLRPPVAQALGRAMEVVPSESIHLVFDVDAEVCRLGYGDCDFKGMEMLQASRPHHRRKLRRRIIKAHQKRTQKTSLEKENPPAGSKSCFGSMIRGKSYD